LMHSPVSSHTGNSQSSSQANRFTRSSFLPPLLQSGFGASSSSALWPQASRARNVFRVCRVVNGWYATRFAMELVARGKLRQVASKPVVDMAVSANRGVVGGSVTWVS